MSERGENVDQEERLRAWVKLYSEKLIRIACMYVKDQSTAEDRVQNAFIKAYQSMNKLKDVDNPLPWLFRIVVNECKSYMKKNRREVVTSVFREQNEKSAEEVYLSQPEFSKLHKAVLELQENYKLPIVCCTRNCHSRSRVCWCDLECKQPYDWSYQT